MLVTPGWVDVHTHYDGQVTWDPILAPSSWHGVTTLVMGNCGVGFAPRRPGEEDFLIELMEGVEDIPGTALHEGIDWRWETFPEYLDALGACHVLDVRAGATARSALSSARHSVRATRSPRWRVSRGRASRWRGRLLDPRTILHRSARFGAGYGSTPKGCRHRPRARRCGVFGDGADLQGQEPDLDARVLQQDRSRLTFALARRRTAGAWRGAGAHRRARARVASCRRCRRAPTGAARRFPRRWCARPTAT
jgi:hypothetical protein